MMTPLADLHERAATHRRLRGRPLVTLSYAQSLDGCLTLHAGEPSPLSGPESMALTHHLRAAHDAILVGIGTVLADDPRLTVRLAEGPDPQPIVLDSQLRFPLDARLLAPGRCPWIATTSSPDPHRLAALEAAGARVLCFPDDGQGHVSLPALLAFLGEMGVNSLMVEGGAHVISSVLRERLADQLVLTIAPVLVGGLHAVDGLDIGAWRDLPRLQAVSTEQAGTDIIVWGTLIWEKGA